MVRDVSSVEENNEQLQQVQELRDELAGITGMCARYDMGVYDSLDDISEKINNVEAVSSGKNVRYGKSLLTK